MAEKEPSRGEKVNIKHMEYVLEVYRCGSINKAAKACYISQSHLSKIVKDVETELGFELFTRSSNGLELNRNGLFFMDSVEHIVAEFQKIRRIPQMINDNSHMHVVSSPSAVVMQGFLAFRRPEAATDHGASDIYKEAGLNDILQQVISRETPLGIMLIFERMVPKYINIAERYGLSLDLVKEKMPVHLLMSLRHPLAQKEKIYVADLERYPFVRDAQIDYDDTLVGRMKLNNSQNSLIVSDRAGRMDAILSGYYICHTTGISPGEQQRLGVCTRPIEDFCEYISVYSLKYANRCYSVRESEFISLLKKQL